ncbi:bifunctional (p)ppGpp synthetase/guanosine-3',5'-bis(diphosphate) 3'-pyrophosphohydrolase [Lachnospiraceae bacterium BX3]|uniref:GTP diphosphokinase n=2 Tax=Jutongia hominis TaxID=2763664 RepID=A0ABR7MV97_9FIRM|nr:bifunctional (p)ppGpp synthetase/guanosine-3',5'-bis(diphosphate) 3'-pyrophosphohydrolase [Jutongia hominis]
MKDKMMEPEVKIDNGELATSMIPEDFTEPEVLFQKLISMVKKYHPSDDVHLIEKAYKIAYKAHDGQKRKSGEPYIIHPVCVCIILAELELDKETIVAGMLHDVVEDTIMTSEEIAAEFSDEVALLVDGVTKLTQLNYVADKVEVQAENLRKMFLAMAKDIRVILIKLADRLHNMRTMQYQTPEKQKEKSTETMDIYAPIADRLGISKVKVELDDLAFRYLEPEMYHDLVNKIAMGQERRDEFIRKIVSEVKSHIEKAGIKATIDGRAKHYFSIYKKMVTQNKKLEQIYDLFAVRIIVETERDCYTALGVIHEIYKPIPGHFKDYIAMPKPNNYQSLHTTLIGPQGHPFEIQIRTYEMHRTAEYGIAAHWKYKENQYGHNTADSEEEKLAWLRRILEWQRDMSDNKEFLSLLKSDLDLFSDHVYCFTKDGDVKNLPADSTPIDFAYAVHSAVGNKMVGARVNGNLVPIDYKIQNGDRVEIMTSQNSRGPSRDWLSIVKSTQAKNKINQWFRSEFKEENIVKGKEMLTGYCKAHLIPLTDLLKTEYMNACLKKYGFRDWDSVLAAIGHGGLKEGQVVNKLQDAYRKKNPVHTTDKQILEAVNKENQLQGQNGSSTKPAAVKSKSGIVVAGIDDVSVRFSKCCSPVPGDEIIGFVTRGRGVSIHRTDCINMMNLSEQDRQRIIEAEWETSADGKPDELYDTEIIIYAYDRMGILLDITKILTENKIDVKSINSRTSKQGIATINVGFAIRSKDSLHDLTKKLLQIDGIKDIQRTQS